MCGTPDDRGRGAWPRTRLGRRRPRPLIDERDLAEEVARSQLCNRRFVAVDPDGAVDEHVELVAGLPLAHQDRPARDVDLFREPTDLLDLLPTELGQKWDMLEEFELLVVARRHLRPLMTRDLLPRVRAA